MTAPTFMYFSMTLDDKPVFTAQWQTIFKARDTTRDMLRHLRARGFECHVWDYHPVDRSGDYEVSIIFNEKHTTEDIAAALHLKTTPLF